MVGTENVKGIDTKSANGVVRKAGRPVCVIVDEVDGVVSGSGGSGEGGFIKALVDLVMLDQKNSRLTGSQNHSATSQRQRKGDGFRMMRPLILICNDVYHPSLKPLRKSTIAQVIHVGKPALSTVIARMQSIFEKEGVQFDGDGVRRLCEATWGLSSRKEGRQGAGSGEGDIRSILVAAEWVAGRLKATIDPIAQSNQRLTRKWIEDHVLADNGNGAGMIRGLGRGGSKEILQRVFQEGAGLSRAALASTSAAGPADITGVKGVTEAAKSRAMSHLRQMIDGLGDSDKVVQDCFTEYPSHPFQDDTLLSKPSAAYDWLNFHDALSSAVYSSNEWELAPYLSQSPLAFHHLFATSASAASRFSTGVNATKMDEEQEEEILPFTGPQASYTAYETQKANASMLQALQSSLSLPLTRSFSSPADIATDLLPYITRMLAPQVNPILIQVSGAEKTTTASVRKASEKALVSRAVNAMAAAAVRFERHKIDLTLSSTDGLSSLGVAQGISSGSTNNGWIYRMEPPLDTFSVYETGGKGFGNEGRSSTGCRYGVRQVLEQEYRREDARWNAEARKRRSAFGAAAMNGTTDADQEMQDTSTNTPTRPNDELRGAEKRGKKVKKDFFGRIVVVEENVDTSGEIADGADKQRKKQKKDHQEGEEGRTWVSFHEGFSNAVRKPLTLAELMSGF